MNLWDGMNERVLPTRFNWINQPNDWSFHDGTLNVFAPLLADFFRDPDGQSIRMTAPFLNTELAGDFTVTTCVEVEMKDDYDSACLMVMVDDLHWAKICFENSYRRPTIVSVVTQGHSDDCNSQSLDIDRPWLRLSRTGNCFAFHYSVDGNFWYMVRYFRMEAGDKVRVGVVSQSPVGDGCNTRFSGFHYDSHGVADIRNGQ